jgi:small subunit ribosomal protein S6
MTLPAPTYDLVLLLDPKAEEAARAKIVADARSAIEAKGELLRHDDWGERAMTYPIDRKPSAEYHLLQVHASTPELLDGLDGSLRILDDILRFRIIKLKPGVPEAPDMRSAAAASSSPAPPSEPLESHAAPASEPLESDAPPAEPLGESTPEAQPEPDLEASVAEVEVGDPA